MKRTWITTDSHFGFKNSSIKWLDIMIDYYYNLFIPTVKKHYKDGDVLIHCGDVFDNRENLNILVMTKVIQLFEDLSKIFPEIYIIAGNHDVYNKNSNDINSLQCLKYIPNVTVIDNEHLVLNSYNKRIAFMPWNETPNLELDVLDRIGYSDYLFAHTSVLNAVYSKGRIIDHGNSVDTFFKYGQVVTGHIHTSQIKENVNILGSPYELTRNDRGNLKSFWLYDLVTGKQARFENTVSPKYILLDLGDPNDKKLLQSKQLIDNNFVDIVLNPELKDTKKYEDIVKLLTSCKSRDITFKFKEVDDTPIDLNNLGLPQVVDGDGYTFLDYIPGYLKGKKISPNIAVKVEKYIKNKMMDISVEGIDEAY